MEILDYNRKFVKSLRVYLKDNFSKVRTGYRYRDYSDTTKYKGIVMTAEAPDCNIRFETWGGNSLVEVTFIFKDDEVSGGKRKIFSSYIEIGSGRSGLFLEEDFKFINGVLDKTSLLGNNALAFILSL